MKKILFVTLLIICSCTKSNEWYNLELTNQNSKIKFPDKPTNRIEKKVVNGIELSVNTFIYSDKKREKKNLVYILTTTTYPDSIINHSRFNKDSILESSAQTVLNSSKMKMISQNKIKLNQLEGREIKVRDNKFIYTYKIYLHKNSVFVMATITNPKNDLNSEQRKFFDSFTTFKKNTSVINDNN